MQNTAQIVFWSSAFLVCYTYFIYPIILFTAYVILQARRDWEFLSKGRLDRRAGRPGQVLPTVSLVVPAYNEEKSLPAKLANLRELEYPPERTEFILVSDGSTDGTGEILRAIRDERFRVVLLPKRCGKANALNCGVAQARNNVLVFSDASTMIAPEALQMIVRHFSDDRVGAVCGTLKFEGSRESKHTEGVYWRYECMLRLMEARLGATLTASGAFYAVRRDCFEPLAINTLLDDFVVPMNVRKRGRTVLYDPEAMATELAPESVAGEFTRRARLAMGSFRALPGLLVTPMSGFTRLAFVSHKLLRWVLPFLLILLAASNLFLLGGALYQVTAIVQLAMLGWGFAGLAFRKQLSGIRLGLLGYFLLAMNTAFLVGFVRCFKNKKEATWARTS